MLLASTLPQSIASFFLVSDGEDRDSRAIVAIQRYVAAVSEINQPFPELGIHVLDRSANARLMCQDFDSRANSAHGALRR